MVLGCVGEGCSSRIECKIEAVGSGSDARCRVSGRHNEVFSQEVHTGRMQI